MATDKCTECQIGFGWFGKPTPCYSCEKPLCGNCAGKYPLVPFNANLPNANDISKYNTIQSFCKACFQATSTIDFSKTSDIIGPESSSTVFVFVHGGGGSRAMFHPHAHTLGSAGFKCVLLDLPGHGSLVSTQLTLDSCVTTVRSVLREHGLRPGDQTIYVGASFGAYTGFYILDKLQEYFKGAVLLDCGQNVGPGASIKARLGMWVLNLVAVNTSNKFLMTSMLSVTKNSPADYRLIESTFGAGMFFDQGAAQCECLQAVAPADFIPKLKIPVLFINGSEDYRDSEYKWLGLCKEKDKSSLKIYQGGDHFFTHDSRFVDSMMKAFKLFACNTV